MLKFIKNWLDNNFLIYLDKLLDRPNVANGLRELSEKQIKKAKDYIFDVLGATNKRVIKEDGNFEIFLPIGEQQNKPFEKMFCVSENGICNAIETNFNYFIHLVNNGKADNEIQELVKIFKHFGLIKNDKCLLDTEYVASGSGTTRRGNSYKKVAHFIRHNGLVPKGNYPTHKTWNELYYPKTGIWINGNKVPTNLLKKGRKLVDFVDISYEWVLPQNHDKAVKRGVFGTSCYAWLYPDNNGIYQNTGLHKNHAVLKPKKSEADFKKIFDSYYPFIKKLALNYSLGYGMLLSFAIKKPFNIYNSEAIKKFKEDKGWDFIVLVENYKNWTQGIYKVNENSLEKIEMNKAVDEWVKSLKENDKIEGVSKESFSKLIT